MSSHPLDGHGLVFSAIHVPERSGVPSRLFGAGAVMFGEPSAVLGMPGVGYFSHCASANAGSMKATISATMLLDTITEPGIPHGRAVDSTVAGSTNQRTHGRHHGQHDAEGADNRRTGRQIQDDRQVNT